MEESNELKERLESTLITRTFNISGMPEVVWKKVDAFCRTRYGDVRWVMVDDLIKLAEIDWKYEMLFEEIELLKEKVASFDKEVSRGVNPAQKPTVKTFGQKEMDKAVYVGDEFER